MNLGATEFSSPKNRTRGQRLPCTDVYNKFYYHFLLKNLGIKRSQLAVPVTRFFHVDATQLEDNHEFELSEARQLKASTGEKCFKLKLLEHPLKEVCRSTKI